MCDYCEKAKLIKPSDGYKGYLYGAESENPHARICRGGENAIHFVSMGSGSYFNINYCPFCGMSLNKNNIK